MQPERAAVAIEVIARRALADAAESLDWADYPDIGENDWTAVVDTASGIAADPAVDVYEDAYRLLSDRAGEQET